MGVIGPATVLRSDIRGVENGVTPGSGSVVQDNYIHDLKAPGSPHYDGLQLDGGLSNIVVRHNTVDMSEHGQTSAVMIDNYFGVDQQRHRRQQPAPRWRLHRLRRRSVQQQQDHRVSPSPNNRLGKGYWGYGLVSPFPVTWTGNVDDKTGKSVPVS